MFEIEAAKIAAKRSTNPSVKTFAANMQKAHMKTTEELKAAIDASGASLTPPTMLPQDLQEDLDDLNKADAKDFDKKYADSQVDAHQAALNLLQRYAQDGDTAALKSFAAATAPRRSSTCARWPTSPGCTTGATATSPPGRTCNTTGSR